MNSFGCSEGLEFKLTLDSNNNRLAWGGGMVLLNGKPIWYDENDKSEEIPVQWTWVDLLEFLGRWWPWIVHEQDYPYPFNPLYPGLLFREAKHHWQEQELPDEQIEKEEKKVYMFLARHDLAEGLKGIFLPSLILLRQGNTCHISAAAQYFLVRPWKEVRTTLEQLGDFLAEAVSESSNPRAQYALRLWRNREERSAEQEWYLTTGFSEEYRRKFEGVDWDSMEVRAVARMSNRTILLSDQQEFLKDISRMPPRETSELDRITGQLLEEFQEIGKQYEQGYWAANKLRSMLGLAWDDCVDPKTWLEKWDVSIEEIRRENCPVEAITVWGRQHGPAIILNIDIKSRATHKYRERATLAHEIGHLILDRDKGLPAGEVLGGQIPEYFEKRARAFAAEFLLPRDVAVEAVHHHDSLQNVASYLQEHYKVSKELLAWQIHNSKVPMNSEEEIQLEYWERNWQA